MQDHAPVSDAAIGRALGNLSYGDDDQAETDSKNSTGPLQQRDLEMVTNVGNRPAVENNDSENIVDEGTSNGSSTYDFSQPQPQSSSSEWVGRKEKLRNLPHAIISNAYDNWTCDNETVTSANRDIRSNHNDGGDEIAWKIIKGILSGWCAIWILFAIIIIAAEVTSPKTPHRPNMYTLMVSEADEQTFLTISENVVSKCAYSKLETESGREECQLLCQNHMCCFNDEDSFGCSDKPEKMCAAYAGCESLIVSEDDAIIYDADGADVFGIGDADPLASNSSDNINEGDEQSQKENVTYETSELQLISEVITTVCSTGNLGNKHGLDECASLCNDGICCFDREQIEFLNPNVDLILELEGITAEKLDSSTMGTCTDEDNLNDGVGDSASSGNYVVFGIFVAMIVVLTVYMLVFQRAGPVHAEVSRVRREINAAREGTATRDEMVEFV
eukprot:scaffold39517_cov150-Skeletonema_dohrnii-CCMP3373.AAC.2